jgi:regulatory protein YycH of two-component signal transduction system YycFG
MRYENIKSAMLTILVLLSAIMTWNLWTYQPNHEMLKQSNYVQEVEIGAKKDIKKIVRPDQMIYHVKEEHYGTTDTGHIDKVMKEMSNWVFFDVQDYTGKIENFNATVHGAGNVEIIFPGEVPIEIYKGVLNIEKKKLPSFHFDRIVINSENAQKDNGVVYFVSSKNRQVYASHITPSNLSNFSRDFYKNADQLPRYFPLETEKRTLFLPEQEKVMNKYKNLPHNLSSDKFKEALFTDPSKVKKSPVQDGEEYTDGTSKMNVVYDENLLLYVNPTEESDYTARPGDLLKRSIDFINEHGGWTDAYRYVYMDELNQEVDFRLYSPEGYPVFNREGMSEIIQEWGRNEITKYFRPNFELGYDLRTETTEVTMPSGREVLDFLQKREGFKIDLLEELSLGYRMEKDSDEQRLIVLEPTWFYRYNKTWEQVTMEDLGGLKRGLE